MKQEPYPVEGLFEPREPPPLGNIADLSLRDLAREFAFMRQALHDSELRTNELVLDFAVTRQHLEDHIRGIAQGQRDLQEDHRRLSEEVARLRDELARRDSEQASQRRNSSGR